MASFSEIHNIVLNASLDNNNEGTIVLKPAKGAKNKIAHYGILKAIERQGSQYSLLENYLDPNDGSVLTIRWVCHISIIGEYVYYYLSMKSLDIKLNIVKKKDDTSIYVFLKYKDNCNYLAAIILDKYLNNYWKIENY